MVAVNALLFIQLLLFLAIANLETTRSLFATNDSSFEIEVKLPGCLQEYPKFNQHHHGIEHQNLIHKLRRLLHGQHLIIMGDSLSRFLYVSLIYALKYNRFNSDTTVPNLVKQVEWGSWYNYYLNSSKVLEPELCDCYRGPEDNYENRYSYDHTNNFNISFFQDWARGGSIKGHWLKHGDNDTSRMPYNYSVPIVWRKDDIIDFFNDVVPQLSIKPSILLFNAGIWLPLDNTQYFAPDHINKIVSSALRVVPRLIYRTTTCPMSHNANFKQNPNLTYLYKSREDLMCSTPGVECFNVSWTRCVKKSSYTEEFHFKAEIYNHMILQFINLLAKHTNVTTL